MQKCLSLLALSTALMSCATLAAGGTGTEKVEASPTTAGRRVDFDRDIRPIFAEHCTNAMATRSSAAAIGSTGGPMRSAAAIRARRRSSRVRGPKAVSSGWWPGWSPTSPCPRRGLGWMRRESTSCVRGSTRGPNGRTIGSRAEQETHWSLTPLARPTVPETRDSGWVRGPIDAFVRAKLAEKGLAPAPEADRRTLIRRVSFDLIGLPPTPEEVDASSPTLGPTPTSGWSIGCWPARATASAGRGTGWTSSTSPRPTATTRTAPGPTPGPTATT